MIMAAVPSSQTATYRLLDPLGFQVEADEFCDLEGLELFHFGYRREGHACKTSQSHRRDQGLVD